MREPTVFHRLVVRFGSALHRGLYRASRGRLAARIGELPILLLTTTGRKSGRSRTSPLGFIRDGANVVVIASNGGMDWPPSWWLNLKHNPAATIEIGRERRAVTARRARGAEHARLWGDITARFPAYAKYQQRTTRAIPVVILEQPRGGAVSTR